MHDGCARAGQATQAVRALIEALVPLDVVEDEHRGEGLRWVDSTADLYRTHRHPVSPRQHLVSYFLLVDDAERLVLLGDHVKSGLWLPSGGHVEPLEHPTDAVRRECLEELSVEARFHPRLGQAPLFVTVTETTGDDPHRDVSLWYVLEGNQSTALRADPREYRSVRWWSVSDVRTADPQTFDPYMQRMLDKIERVVWP